MQFGASKNAETRRRAEEKFAKAKQREQDIVSFQRQVQQAEEAKFARLRALRLAKEASDRDALALAEAEAAATAEKTKPAKRIRRPKVVSETKEQL
jgi:hypothetical protein